MLEGLIFLVLTLWLLGLVTSSTMGGTLHVLLVVAIVLIVVRWMRRRRIA